MKNFESPMYIAYFHLYNITDNRTWASKIQSVIKHLGSPCLLHNVYEQVLPVLKQRIRDQYIQS